MGIISWILSLLTGSSTGRNRRSVSGGEWASSEKRMSYVWRTVQTYYENSISDEVELDPLEMEKEVKELVDQLREGRCGLAGEKLEVEIETEQIAEILYKLMIAVNYRTYVQLDKLFSDDKSGSMQSPEKVLTKYRHCIHQSEVALKIAEDFELGDREKDISRYLRDQFERREEIIESLVENDKSREDLEEIKKKFMQNLDSRRDRFEKDLKNISSEVERKKVRI